MSPRSSKRILFLNGLTDSENNFDNENENFTLHKRRRNICSTSESEAEELEEGNDSYYDSWTSKTFVPKIHQFAPEDSGINKYYNKY